MLPTWFSWTTATASRRRPEATLRAGVVAASLMAILGACTPTPPSGKNLPTDALDDAIGAAVGDPATCVLLADRATRKVVYRFGTSVVCRRTLPACDRPGFINPETALSLAATPGGHAASCPSNPEHTAEVAWSAGKVESGKRDLIYSAVMEGRRTLPGREMAVRLQEAFAKAGI